MIMARRGLCSRAGAELTVRLEAQGRVAVVGLNRPHRMNALSFDMGGQLLDLPAMLPDSARAVVLVGEGKAFSTGRDLKDSKAHSAEEKDQYMRLARDTVLAMRRSELPTVAAINGAAFGWGLEMALACDLRVASDDALLCFPETSLGIFRRFKRWGRWLGIGAGVD